MLMLISPAKSLDETTPVPFKCESKPVLLEQAAELMDSLQTLVPDEIAQLMHISDKLAELNYQRFQDWQVPFSEERAKQAAWLFKGDVYQGLDAYGLSEGGVKFLQTHLRILSGLYGLLKPCDKILPYRLEMGTKYPNAKGKDIYAFWGEQITEQLNLALQAMNSRTVVNLASNEYFKAVQPNVLNAQIITPIFKDWKGGKYKIISFYAKKARGLMVRYATDHRVEHAEELKHFNVGGYRFAPELSNETDWVFTRKIDG
ncbi:UPF0246 protein YaaA [hydrothermal vent metagenome]|uniref:UPF0246 protein YaaA n=1 Tax=hydrothermal vent metagenome TaxID=652676 RepID=A0A3B0W1J8_9ZZZZ